jgi:hypothetical protein
MRRIVLHRRAVKYLRCMPRDRQAQIVQAHWTNPCVVCSLYVFPNPANLRL